MRARGEGVAAAMGTLPPPREGKFVGKHSYFRVVDDQQSKLTRRILRRRPMIRCRLQRNCQSPLASIGFEQSVFLRRRARQEDGGKWHLLSRAALHRRRGGRFYRRVGGAKSLSIAHPRRAPRKNRRSLAKMPCGRRSSMTTSMYSPDVPRPRTRSSWKTSSCSSTSGCAKPGKAAPQRR